LSTGKG